MTKAHSFHIPVMGIGFTIDTPIKVSQYGIDSVISIGDDILLEKLRKMYCEKHKLPYAEISDKIEDSRAKRITSYLNLVKKLVSDNFQELKTASLSQVKRYFKMLPDNSPIKLHFEKLLDDGTEEKQIKKELEGALSLGDIDVNIMTKLDKENYIKDEKLPVEYNDAHAALRGFANSDLHSSIVFSAGMNPRLYSYLSSFDDFYPNEEGVFKKKIVLKVSDYRSALVQGKFLAKKGIWVSEYRIESGLNCGGHAFATDGYLMGPILAEFRDKREELRESIYDIYVQTLTSSGRTIPKSQLALKVTAQGGVGTAEEHDFLIDHYNVDSVGWGTPFLLVPEATTVDTATMEKLVKAKEDDLYLSNISPLGVPFHNLKGNTKDLEKIALVKKGRSGSSCPKKFLSLNKEFDGKAICTASRQYQYLKLQELEKEEGTMDADVYQAKFDNIVEKSCICVGLGTAALLENDLDTKVEGEGVSICPGPNMAYFSKIMSLKEITDHIYGRTNVISRPDRPNMFVKELNIYIDYLRGKVDEAKLSITEKQKKYLQLFEQNLMEGINYYQEVFSNLSKQFKNSKSSILYDLGASKNSLRLLYLEIEKL
jgi:hypothetical protein